MKRTIFFIYGVVSYLLFFVTFLYSIGFIGGLVVPKHIDSGEPGLIVTSILINVLLLGLFAIQHSGMARPTFKAWWTQTVPAPIERSTYVLLSSLALIVMFYFWQPLPAAIWKVDDVLGVFVLECLFFLGWFIVLYSTFLISHFDLFGLKQVADYYKDKAPENPTFAMTSFYRLVRHPIMLGFIIAFWATPLMTVGHLLFAVGATGYVLLALQLEERNLVEALGERYSKYQQEVPMLVPLTKGVHIAPAEESQPQEGQS